MLPLDTTQSMQQSGIFEQIIRPAERLFSPLPPPAQARGGTFLQPTDEYSDHWPFLPMRPPTRRQIYGPENQKGGVIRLIAMFPHTIKAKCRIITIRSPITALGNFIFARPTHFFMVLVSWRVVSWMISTTCDRKRNVHAVTIWVNAWPYGTCLYMGRGEEKPKIR